MSGTGTISGLKVINKCLRSIIGLRVVVGIIDHGLKGSSREIYAHDFFGLLKKQYKNNFFTSGLAGMASVLI